MVKLAQRCAAVEMLVLDVDGVLTAGGIVYADNDVELKTFHVRDGSALKLWQHAGKRCAILSGRTAHTVAIRAAELGIAPVVQGAPDKLFAYRGPVAETGLAPAQ